MNNSFVFRNKILIFLLILILSVSMIVPALAYDDGTLYNGCSGEEVKAMQQALINLGYLEGTADGQFGDKTEEAVKAFQRKNGLTPDGLAGKKTRSMLDSAKKGSNSTTPTGKTAKSPVYSEGTLYNGCSGEEVRLLQQALIELGYLEGTADGTFGDQTEAAIRAFQGANGLNADGLAGTKTRSKLEKARNRNSGSEVKTTAGGNKSAGIDWSTLERKARQVLKAEGYSTEGMNYIEHDYIPKDVANGFPEELYWVTFYKSKESKENDKNFSVLFDYKWDMIKFEIHNNENTTRNDFPTENDIDQVLLDKAKKEARAFLKRNGKTELLKLCGSLYLECINITQDNKIYYTLDVLNTFAIRVQVSPSVQVEWFHVIE